MNTLSQTIKEAISREGYPNVKQCAQDLQIPYELFRKVVGEDHIPKDNQILIYASKLKLNPEELLLTAYRQKAPAEFKECFKAEKSLPGDNFTFIKIPIIEWRNIGVAKRLETQKKRFVTNLQGINLFAMRIVDDSMSPFFSEGEDIVVETEISITEGDFVVSSTNGNAAVLRKLKVFGEVTYLIPLNPKYSESELTEDTKIWGRVIRKQKNF